MDRIYFDHNATTPQHPEVTRAMAPFVAAPYGNPSSVHEPGRRARAAVEEAREEVARLLGGDPGGVILTGGATEANNLALVGRVAGAGPGAHLLVSAVEHPSVAVTADWLAGTGVTVSRLPVDAAGRVDPEAVREALRPESRLVSIQGANHETGVLQPLAEVARVTRRAGVPLHADLVQLVGRVPVDVDALGVDLATISGHKIFGPRGIGALWVRPGTRLTPLLHGGGQEGGRRAGTENLPAAVGLGVAARRARTTPECYGSVVGPLRDRLEHALCAAWPGAVVHGAAAPRVANTASIGFPGLDGEAALMRFDLEGVALSLGSACDAGALRPSEVLRALGVSEALARGSLRFSLGPDNTAEEVDRAAAIFRGCLAVASSSANAGGRSRG